MLSSIDEKLQLLALDSEEFSQGLANLSKFYINNKKDSRDVRVYTEPSPNYLALENNTPVLGG